MSTALSAQPTTERIAAAEHFIATELVGATGNLLPTNSFQAEDLGAPSHGSPPRAHRPLPRHRLSLCRRHRISRSHRIRVAAEPYQSPTRAHGRAAGIALRHPEPNRSHPLLQSAQGPASLLCAGKLRRLVHRSSSRAGQSSAALKEVDDFSLRSGRTIRKLSPLARVVRERPVGRPTPPRTISRCSISTTRATPASVASHAPRSCSIPTTRFPVAGEARCSSAASTSILLLRNSSTRLTDTLWTTQSDSLSLS